MNFHKKAGTANFADSNSVRCCNVIVSEFYIYIYILTWQTEL